MKHLPILFIFPLLLTIATGAVELLGNYDFESSNYHNNWYCVGCHLTPSSDSYSGSHSVLVDRRSQRYSGLRQQVTLQPGGRYSLSVFIKVKAAPPTLQVVPVDLYIACLKSDGSKTYMAMGRDPFIQPGTWAMVGGERTIPNDIHGGCYVYVQILDPSVTYLADHASLQAVADDKNWKQEAMTRIEQLRKANITVHLTGNVPGDLDIKVSQVKQEFGFGTAVNCRTFLEPSNSAYRDVIYELFEWAVLENALKWNHMEKHQGVIDYNTPLTVIKALRAHGMKVRAHNIFWGVERYVPSWVKTLNKTELLQAMDRRINGVVTAVKGLVEHWDVNNENLHGDWFETSTSDVNITMKMFHDARRVDPNVQLFLNDYGIVESWAAAALAHQATYFKASGVPINGVGVQSHLKNVPLDIPTVKGDIELVGQAGLPVWITELTVSAEDKQMRANGLEDAMTLYFSLPEVHGILLWGFWDGSIFRQNASLFEGTTVQPNEAGKVLRRLLTSWRTDVTHHTSGTTETFSTRGFKGTYNVTVTSGNHVLSSETFTLGNDGKTVTIHIDGTSPSIIVG